MAPIVRRAALSTNTFTNAGTTALGAGAQAGATAAGQIGATAVGALSTANATMATALGAQSNASGNNSTAIGATSFERRGQLRLRPSQQRAAAGRQLGSSDKAARRAARNSLATWPRRGRTGTNAAAHVALGQGSIANLPNTVSVGAPGAERRITNVAAGVNPTDAVNVSQLSAALGGGGIRPAVAAAA